MPDTPTDEELHAPHEKHLQLGFDPAATGPASERELSDDDKDALWADATTVEQYAADLEALRGEPDDVVDALRADREGR
jgi:hypothetical protein